MNTKQVLAKCYCNVEAMEKGITPTGHAGDFEDAVIVEMPLPWKREYGAFPDQIMDLLQLWLENYRETGIYGHLSLLVAPDPDYSVTGFRRVMFYTKPEGLFAEYQNTEYLVPNEQVGAIVWAWYQAPETLAQYDGYKQLACNNVRDILVCTHGTVDAACAKFGYPLYKHLRDNCATDQIRIWRVSHFGGHIFAPTLMDMPKGDYWAYVEAEQGDQIIYRNEDVARLHKHYRGWAGLEYGFLQAAEGECLMREGWQWQQFRKTGFVLQKDESEAPQWADVRIEYAAPDGSTGCYEAHVIISKTITTHPSTGTAHEYDYPQYTVATIQRIENKENAYSTSP